MMQGEKKNKKYIDLVNRSARRPSGAQKSMRTLLPLSQLIYIVS